MTKGENLQLQGCPSPEGGADGAIHRNQQGEHGNGSLAAEPRQLQLIWFNADEISGSHNRRGQANPIRRTLIRSSCAEQLIELLRLRFSQTKLIVLGPSYGSLLGIELACRRPDLVRAYVGVGQDACADTEAGAIQDGWLRREAMAVGDANTLAAINGGQLWNRAASFDTAEEKSA